MYMLCDNVCISAYLLTEIFAKVQILTGSGGNFACCVPPDDLTSDSDPKALLQQRALLQQFAAHVANQDAYLVMHPRHVTSNMAGLDAEVCACCLTETNRLKTSRNGASKSDILAEYDCQKGDRQGAFDTCCCTWKLPRDRINTCIIVSGCDSAAKAADTVAPLHTPQEKELPALSVWGSLQGAEAVCTLMGISLGMAEQLCASLQALRESPKSHTSVPEVRIIWPASVCRLHT